MYISYKLLKTFVDLEGIALEEFVRTLTISGVEVESMTPVASGSNLIIGEVVACVDHPQSNHLHVCQVNLGSCMVQIVCGASNVAQGQ